jgi:uncharacterized protein YcbX
MISVRARLGRVRDLWRYPVMGLQGERLQTAEIREAGVVGDHRYVFHDSEAGRVIDPVTYAHRWGETLAFPSMLDLRARFATGDSARLDIITPDGRVLSSGDPDFQTQIRETLGVPVKLMEFPQVAEARVRAGRALHLITTASLDSMKDLYPEGDFDPRRFRPNIIVSSQPERNGFIEESWVGESIRIGPEVVLRVEKTNRRCKVTTMKQDDLPSDGKILETISQKNGNVLGVMCSVVKGGIVAVGDELESSPAGIDELPQPLGIAGPLSQGNVGGRD